VFDRKACYEVSGSYLSKILINLGAMLMGAALLSYIAANWMEFSRVTKISLILLAYVCSVLFAWMTDKRSQILSRGLLLLSSFAYGGGIFLIAQIFHEGGHYTTALLMWIIGLIPVCLLFKDRLQLTLIQIISIVYLIGYFSEVYHRFSSINDLFFVLWFYKWQVTLVIGLWVLWLQTRGRINFNLNMFASIIFVSWIINFWTFRGNDIVLYLYVLGMILGLTPRGKYEDINTWGIVLVGLCGLWMTNVNTWRFDYYALRNYIYDMYPHLGNVLTNNVLAVCSGILTCALMVLFMFKNSLLAVFFFCAIILRYFFDRFYDFMPKSVLFAVGGIILVAAGLLIGKIYRIKKGRKAENALKEAN
jgi:uncharacterized membrane protein